MQVSINQFFKGPNGTKDRERTYLLFIWVETFRLGLRFKPLEPPTTPILRPLDSNWDLTISSPVSQAFGLNYSISLPASLACSWQIVGLLGLHIHVSRLLVINLFMYIRITILSSLSGEPWLIQARKRKGKKLRVTGVKWGKLKVKERRQWAKTGTGSLRALWGRVCSDAS